MSDMNEISAHEMGRRLRLARENAGIKQEDAAHILQLSRPTLVSIEKGSRRIRIQELQKLAGFYGVSVNSILRREAVHTDLIPRYRKLIDSEDKYADEAINILNDLVRAEIELENILGIKHVRNYPPEKGINKGDVHKLAEDHAQELRNWMGLGSGPVSDIFTIIELNLGIRLYQRRLSSGSKVAGLFTYDPEVGACILLNANHPLERRIQSAAHELGHFYGTRQVPEVLEYDENFLSRDERYANAFGHAFLTPRISFERSFRQLTEEAERLTRRHVIILSHQHGISREACVRRLEDLGLIKKGTWDWFQAHGGITNDQAREVLGQMHMRPDPAKDEANLLVPHRIASMAYEAWKRGLMSEGQLANLLKVPRIEIRSLVDQIELEEIESDDILKLSRT